MWLLPHGGGPREVTLRSAHRYFTPLPDGWQGGGGLIDRRKKNRKRENGMKKRILAMVLALVLVAALCPAALAAGKLSTPTDLQWDVERWSADDSWPSPGAMSCCWGENTAGIIRLIVYRNNAEVTRTYYYLGEDEGISYLNISLSEMLAYDNLTLESGTYYFTAQNVNDQNSVSANDSAVATSPKWTYNKPSAKLAAPTDPTWAFPYCTWQPKAERDQYDLTAISFYYSKTKTGSYEHVFGSATDIVGKDSVETWCLEENGAGYYKFRVLTLSRDISQWQSSDWSALSEPYYYDGSPVNICRHYSRTSQNWKEATCTEPGYTGDEVCVDCGEVLERGEVEPALGHDPDSDGFCWRCGKQIELHGSLGAGSALRWTYSTLTNAVTLKGSIPSGDVVYAACFKSGRFVGVKAMTAAQLSVALRSDLDQVRLIWLDSHQTPQCASKDIPLDTL